MRDIDIAARRVTGTVQANALRLLQKRVEQSHTAPLAIIIRKLIDADTSDDDVRRAMRDLERAGQVSSRVRGGRGRRDRATIYQLERAA